MFSTISRVVNLINTTLDTAITAAEAANRVVTTAASALEREAACLDKMHRVSVAERNAKADALAASLGIDVKDL